MRRYCGHHRRRAGCGGDARSVARVGGSVESCICLRWKSLLWAVDRIRSAKRRPAPALQASAGLLSACATRRLCSWRADAAPRFAHGRETRQGARGHRRGPEPKAITTLRCAHPAPAMSRRRSIERPAEIRNAAGRWVHTRRAQARRSAFHHAISCRRRVIAPRARVALRRPAIGRSRSMSSIEARRNAEKAQMRSSSISGCATRSSNFSSMRRDSALAP